MSDRARFLYGGPSYRPGDPAVRRVLERTQAQYDKLLRAGLPDEVERIKAEAASRSPDVETRLMITAQLVGVAITRKKAASYRQSIQDGGFTRITLNVEESRAKELRRVVIAEAKRMGIRVRASEGVVMPDTTHVVDGTPLGANSEGGRPALEANQGTSSGHPSSGSSEQQTDVTPLQLNKMQQIARERGIKVDPEAIKSKRAATAWITAHESGRN